MIRYTSQKQIAIEEFKTPLETKLSRENRWVKLAEALPWDKLAAIYHRALSATKGRQSVCARIVIGAMIIKHLLELSDEGTLESIQENMYQQYFLGLRQYQYAPVFDSSLFVTIRKRLGVEAFDAMVLELMRVAKLIPQKNQEELKDQQEKSELAITPSQEDIQNKTQPSHNEEVTTDQPSGSIIQTEEQPKNAGMLIVDMSVAPADITYPTDINLLNTAREKTELLIDVIYNSSELHKVKPRTYRKRARRDYLAIAKQRKKSLKSIRKALRKQLGYVGRNIKTIHKLLDITPKALRPKEMKMFWVIQELYRQQKEMYDTKTNRISDRIVSIFQPHVRPIVRGKEKAKTEFGAQVSVSIMNGFKRVHSIKWDAYNEGNDLKEQVESYKLTYGVYPKIVLADKKYGSKDNRLYMKKFGIRYGGTPLGHPTKNTEQLLPKNIVNQRNHIEGTFGLGKRAYGLDCIKARLSDTSISWISMIFLVMNLPLVLKSLGSSFLSILISELDRLIEFYGRYKMATQRYIFAIP
jgi:IS5 family transposase